MLIQIHINQNLIKKKLGRHYQKWVQPEWSRDFKTDCKSKMNTSNELIFLHAGAHQES